jgi:hypothetical protein
MLKSLDIHISSGFNNVVLQRYLSIKNTSSEFDNFVAKSFLLELLVQDFRGSGGFMFEEDSCSSMYLHFVNLNQTDKFKFIPRNNPDSVRCICFR